MFLEIPSVIESEIFVGNTVYCDTNSVREPRRFHPSQHLFGGVTLASLLFPSEVSLVSVGVCGCYGADSSYVYETRGSYW